MMDEDLIDLLALWRGAPLDPDRGRELIARLSEDEGFQQRFVDEVLMLGKLKAVQSMEPRWLPLQEELGWGAEPPLSEQELEDEVMRQFQHAAPPKVSRLRSWRAVAASVAVAVAASAAILMAVIVVLWPPRRREVPIPVERPSGVKPEGELAVLTKLDGVRWETIDGRGPAEGTVLPPGRFRLRRGRAVLAFFNGVTLTVEGPADVDLLSVNRVFCRQGRLRARVPKGAEGFVVASAGSEVVDLGTEFAINVDAQGKARVMVFEGAAKALLLDDKGVPRQNELVERSKALELDPRAGHIAPTAGTPEGFAPAGDLNGRTLRLDPAYRATVLQSHPRSFWRFESLVDGTVPNELSGGRPLRLNGPVSVAHGPEVNGYALFHPSAPHQCLTTDGLWELKRDPGHAVEFWFLSERISKAALVALYPPPESNTYEFVHVYMMLVELTAHPRPSMEKPASVRFLHRGQRGAGLGYVDSTLLSRRSYMPGRWHHVVAQRDGTRMDLYFDGVRDYSMSLENDPPSRLCRLAVGRRTADLRLTDDCRPFVGRLDELAIYDHPLSAAEIQQHFRLATPIAPGK